MKDIDELVKALRDTLPEKVDYGEYHAWEDLKFHIINEAADLIKRQAIIIEQYEALMEKVNKALDINTEIERLTKKEEVNHG